MYLKRVEMRGFKSFADKTIVEFKQGVTCVVGPNGSGKSNITDAVRWVLGEQRVKTLRGNKMEDVIFNGTKHRKPLGLAEVKLIFDNSEQFFPLEFDEISVVRRVHRSGESEYLINNMPCRLKDIRELFMDTGIGREGYSIIGQGRIDEILSSNKDERRLLFEEAAGIIKYKTRKQESERKLKSTNENLLRIEDILSEIEDRVAPLKKESDRARRYLELTEKLKNIELNYFAKRFGICETSLVEIVAMAKQNQDEIEAIEQNKQLLQSAYNEKDQHLYKLNREIRTLEENYYEKVNLKSRTSGEKELIQEKIQNVESNVKRLHVELDEITQEQNEIKSALNKLEGEKADIHKELTLMLEAIEGLELTFKEKQEEVGKIKLDSDTERQEIFSLLNEIEFKKSEIENLNKFNLSIKNKMDDLEHQIEEIDIKVVESESAKETYEEAVNSNQERLSGANDKLANALKDAKYFKTSLEEKRTISEKLTKQISEDTTERKLLMTLEEEYDGYDKGVKDILLNLPDKTGIQGIVATLIDVPKKYETAIEVALGRSIQHIVCEHAKDAKRSIDYLRKHKLGRVTFLPLNQIESNGQQNAVVKEAKKLKGYLGVASDLINCDAKYTTLIEYLLGRIMIVSDFETAQKCLEITNIKYKIITLEGDVLIPGGTITGGSFKSRVSNILGRKRRISELEVKINDAQSQLEATNKEVGHLIGLIDDNDVKLRDVRSEIDQLNIELARLQNMMENAVSNLQSIKDTKKKAQRDYDVLAEEWQNSEAECITKEADIQKATIRVGELEDKISDVKGVLESAEVEIENLADNITTQKIKLASLEQLETFKEREMSRIIDDLKTISQKIDNRQAEINQNDTKRDDFYQKVEDIDLTLKTIDEETQAINDKIAQNNQEKVSLSDAVKRDFAEISACTEKINALKEASHKLEVKKAKHEVEKENIISELWDKYEITIGEAIEVEDMGGSVSEMKQLKSDIRAIGNVNIGAIKEYEEVSERYTFLKTQQKDLQEAIDHLVKIIGDLETKMTLMFKEHFDVISNHFKDTFRMLFNGGDAELLLADYDQILECDIEIIAQPPGKKLQSINLLSGGEKALTAIALLFAILRTKPTPFCILDEIEAALDDVNVYRFADFIKEYAANSQFVVITHRKGTMEIADTLYGVTMEEYGISKVLSVRFEDVKDAYQ